MKDITDNPNVTYVFTHTTLLEALNEWQQEQVENYPQQAERIQITTLAMQHFLRSKQVKAHKMIISGNPESFEIETPSSWDLEKTTNKE